MVVDLTQDINCVVIGELTCPWNTKSTLGDSFWELKLHLCPSRAVSVITDPSSVKSCGRGPFTEIGPEATEVPKSIPVDPIGAN